MRFTFITFLIGILVHSASLDAKAQDNPIKRNFFSSWHVSSFSEFGTTAPMDYNVYDYDNDVWKIDKTHFTYFNFLGITYEPRFNLISFADRASFSVSLPLSGKVNIDLDDDNIFVIGGLGAYVDFNIGNRSTFNNIDANGYALGLGMDMDKYLTGDVDGMVYSPMARLKVMNLVNSVHDYYFGLMLKAGIPVVYDNSDGETSVGNKNFGIYISLGF